MQRRSFLSGLAAAAVTRKRPNVVLLLTDDQRADTISALGNPSIRTPNLDALARKSVVFTNAYCMGGNNPAVCTPSRNMLFSGRAYTRFNQIASAKDPNWPDAMKQAGYTTYHHGKRGNTATEIQARFDVCKYVNDEEVRRSGAPGRIIVDDAIAYLKSRPQDRPFFLSLSFEAPHDPRVPSAEDRDYYANRQIPLPKNFLPMHPFDNGEMKVRDELLAPFPRTEDEIRRHLREYYAVITGLDRQIGRLLNVLPEQDTIVLFTSDQGLAIGSHGLMGKQNLYDHSMKVPLLISGPGIRPGRAGGLVYLHDLFPTVLDQIGAPVPAGLDGRSFAPLLENPSRAARDSLFLAYRSVQRALRDPQCKLIVYPEAKRTQLFDLVRDPDEIHDLSGESGHGPRIEKMQARLRRWQEELGDPLRL